jgi:hypothetical protein
MALFCWTLFRKPGHAHLQVSYPRFYVFANDSLQDVNSENNDGCARFKVQCSAVALHAAISSDLQSLRRSLPLAI